MQKLFKIEFLLKNFLCLHSSQDERSHRRVVGQPLVGFSKFWFIKSSVSFLALRLIKIVSSVSIIITLSQNLFFSVYKDVRFSFWLQFFFIFNKNLKIVLLCSMNALNVQLLRSSVISVKSRFF